MTPGILSTITRNTFLLIGQILVCIFCIAYINFVYFENILPDKRVAEDFTVVTCTVLNKKLEERHHLGHSYRAVFLLSYVAGGKQYQSMATGNGLDHAFISDLASQQLILNQFELGGTYPCRVDPTEYKHVVLVLRHSWSSTLPLVLPSLIALIMLYYIGKELFMFFGVAALKMREKKNDR